MPAAGEGPSSTWAIKGVVNLDGVMLLSPGLRVVPRLSSAMARLRRARKLSLTNVGGPSRRG